METNELVYTAGIDGLVQDLLISAGAPGSAVALAIDGEPWSAGIGYATRDGSQPLDASARFSAYSITKTVIATIVMRLVEDGALSLDDPIDAHLPQLPIDTPVSIRQILNHIGGLPDYGGLAGYHDAVRDHPESPWTSDQFLEWTLANGLLFEPGNGWRYSNIGYMLLRLMIERITRRSFREAVRDYLAQPFGLRELTVIDSLHDVVALTPGYSATIPGDGAVENVIARYHPGWVSHGLVVATAPELARFVEMLFGGGIVEQNSLTAMLTAERVPDTHPWMTTPSYGLGLMIDLSNRFGLVAGHTGGGPGYSTAAYHFPDVGGHRVTSVALVNRDGSDIATDIAFSMVERIAEAFGSD